MMKSEVRGRRDSGGDVKTNQLPILAPGVALFGATLAAQLISLRFGRIDLTRDFASTIVPSLAFLTVITVPAIALGMSLGRDVGLGAPLLTEWFAGRNGSGRKLVTDALLATGLGLALGAALLGVRAISAPHLPPEIPAYGHRGVVGGLAVSLGAAVGEEVWFRLGLMTVLVWCLARLLGQRQVRPAVIWSVIVLTSVAFGAAHLPQLISYGAGSPFAIGGTMAGNIAVGILYGWCYWRRSLVAATVAHFAVDLVIHVLPALLS